MVSAGTIDKILGRYIDCSKKISSTALYSGNLFQHYVDPIRTRVAPNETADFYRCAFDYNRQLHFT